MNCIFLFGLFSLLSASVAAYPRLKVKPTKARASRRTRDYHLELIQRLIGRGYSKLAKPVQLENSTFKVKARLYLIKIQAVDEARETIFSTIRLQLSWIDSRLSWFPHNFNGITELVVPGGYLWVPPLHISNSVDESIDIIRGGQSFDFGFRINSNGKVWYHPTGKAATRCKFDLTYYPFDYQRCLIIIESEIYQDKELKIMTREDDIPGAISFGMLAENEVWELIAEHTYGLPKVYQSGTHTKFSRVHFVMVMKRKPAFFIVTILIPTFILAIITLLTYLVPVHYVDRPVQSVTTVLAVAIFESTVAEKLPSNSANCLLTIYLTIIMCSSAVTVLTTTICLAVVDPGEFIKAPWGIPNIFSGIANTVSDCCLCLRNRTRKQASPRSRSECLEIDPFSGQISKVKCTASKNRCCQAKCCVQGTRNTTVIDDSDVGIEFNADGSDGFESRNRRSTPTARRAIVALSCRHGRIGSYGYQVRRRNNARISSEAATNTVKKRYEAGRRFLASRQAWFVAYTVNWIGFSICLIATVSVPVLAWLNKAKDDEIFFNDFRKAENSILATHYYGYS